MPPWALGGMLNAHVMALHKLTREVVEKRLGILGGTARLVLRLDARRAVDDEERLVGAVQSADALQSLKVSSDMKAISKTTHFLVKMHPKRKFSWFDTQLSSPHARQELVKRTRQDNFKELSKSPVTSSSEARRLTTDCTGSEKHRNSKVQDASCP